MGQIDPFLRQKYFNKATSQQEFNLLPSSSAMGQTDPKVFLLCLFPVTVKWTLFFFFFLMLWANRPIQSSKEQVYKCKSYFVCQSDSLLG